MELESLVLALVEALVEGPLWGLPTWHGASGGQRLLAQELGTNVVAVRVAVEAVGTCARALGPSFASNGRLLRAALLPVLERLGT